MWGRVGGGKTGAGGAVRTPVQITWGSGYGGLCQGPAEGGRDVDRTEGCAGQHSQGWGGDGKEGQGQWLPLPPAMAIECQRLRHRGRGLFGGVGCRASLQC